MSNVALDITLSLQRALQTKMDVLSNNAANAGTHGFQADNVVFSEYLGKSDDNETYSYLNDVATYRNLHNGSLNKTGNPFHVALQSAGYFAVQSPQGIQYTRAGAFVISPTGVLVDVNADPVLSIDGGEIAIPGNSQHITISPTGMIADENGVIAQLGVFGFDNEYDIRKVGQTRFETDQAANPITDQANMIQGALENANLNPIKNMSDMMWVAKTYNLNQRYIEEQLKLETEKVDVLAQSAPAA